jgi:hypothetical protein
MTTTTDGSLVPQANFGDTCTALLWIERLGRYVAFGRKDGSTPGAKCVAGDGYGNFRQVAAIVESDSHASSFLRSNTNTNRNAHTNTNNTNTNTNTNTNDISSDISSSSSISSGGGGVVKSSPQRTSNAHGNDASPSFAVRSFNVTPRVIFHTDPGTDSPCVDFYNPAPIDVHGVTFIFPSATRHLTQPGKPNTSFPSP